jgi:hypothetical protein
MANKNLKLTLTTLFGGVIALSAVSTLALTSCNEGVKTDVITTVEQANAYLLQKKSLLNKTETAVVQQNTVLANDASFNNFLNTNLTAQNLANSIVQTYATKLTVVPESGITSVKLSVKVNGNNLLFVCEQEGMQEEVPMSQSTTYDLTLTPGSLNGDVLTQAKLKGKISVVSNGTASPDIIYGGDEGLLMTKAGTSVVTSSLYINPAPGTYNIVCFGDTTSSVPGANIVFYLSGKINTEVDPNASSLDTENVTFIPAN